MKVNILQERAGGQRKIRNLVQICAFLLALMMKFAFLEIPLVMTLSIRNRACNFACAV